MNKLRIVQLSIGGVAAAGVLVLGYLTWSAASGGGDAEEELEFLKSDASRLSHQKVYPNQASLDALAENRTVCSNWLDLARLEVSVGDRAFEPTTPPAFKTYLVGEAKRLAEKPGAENGKFAKAGFGFGFDEFVNKGKLPAVADLPRLQREWGDIESVVEILAEAGATSVADIALVRAAAAEEPAPRARRAPEKGKAGKSSDDGLPPPDVTRFTITFTAGAEALVTALNRLATDPRFRVVETMSFARVTDEIAAKLGEKPRESEGASGRRRRRQAALAADQKPNEKDEKGGVVSDPAQAADLKVSMTIAAYDFHSAAKKPAAEDAEEVEE